MSEDQHAPEGGQRPDPAQPRRIQEEVLISMLMSIRAGGGSGGSSQLPGPGLQRRAASSWEVFNNTWRKKG